MAITHLKEARRGCGYRQKGAMYLRTDGITTGCGLMPIPLDVCPTCHHGIHPARAWTWINLRELTRNRECSNDQIPNVCNACPVRQIDLAGLLWIGKKYYKTPKEFLEEAQRMGVSRKIPAIPKNFKLGETWVCVAHRKVIESPFRFGEEPKWTPAIFHLFKPTRIEYVVRGNESQEKLDKMESRGLSLVQIEEI